MINLWVMVCYSICCVASIVAYDPLLSTIINGYNPYIAHHYQPLLMDITIYNPYITPRKPPANLKNKHGHIQFVFVVSATAM